MKRLLPFFIISLLAGCETTAVPENSITPHSDPYWRPDDGRCDLAVLVLFPAKQAGETG